MSNSGLLSGTCKFPEMWGAALLKGSLHCVPSTEVQFGVAAAAKSLQSCPTLSDPMDCSLPGSSAHGIFQARVLEWGAIAFSVVWS